MFMPSMIVRTKEFIVHVQLLTQIKISKPVLKLVSV